jgi:DNA-binding CsgD family transcriptional regulator
MKPAVRMLGLARTAAAHESRLTLKDVPYRFDNGMTKVGDDSNSAQREATEQGISHLVLSPPRGLSIDVFRVGDEEYALLSHDAPACTPGQALAGVLSGAELLVVEALLRGGSVSEIARLRGVSPLTVRNQIRSAYAKLGVSSRGELGRRIATQEGDELRQYNRDRD